LQILSLNGFRLALVRLHAYACEARGHPRAGLVVIGAQVALGTPASIIAAHYGIVWVAAAFTMTGYAVFPLSFVFLRNITGVSIRQQFVALRGVLVSAGLMFVAVVAVQHVLDPLVARSVTLVVAVGVGVLSYFALMGVLDRNLLAGAMRDMTRRNKS